MAERWQGMGTKEAAGYKEKIDTAWDDLYMGDKGSSSGRSDLRKFLKVAGGLGILNLYGSRQVEKYGNDALSRANDIRLDLQQQELMLQNDIRAASIVGNREKRMMEDGIIDYQDPQQIMEWIVNNPDTGLDKEKVARWNEKYGSGKALEGGVSQYNFEDTSILRDIFNDEQSRKAENLFKQHMKTSAHYKGLRGPGNVMPYMITTDDGKTIIDDQGYLNNVRAAVANIDTITAGIKKDVEGMKWTDGILLKLGIKKLDREFIIKEQIAEEVNRKTSAEVKRRLQFNLKQTDADENLTAQLQLRIEQGITKDIKDMDMPSAFKILSIVTPAVGNLTGQAAEDIYMSSEQYISEIAEQAVTNTLNDEDGTVSASMAGIVESAESDDILMGRYTDMIGQRSSALSEVKKTIKELRLPSIEDSPLTPDIDESFIPSERFDKAFNEYWKIVDEQGDNWNEGEFNRIKGKLGYDAQEQLRELEYDLINTGLQLIPYSGESRQIEIKNQLRQLTGRRDSLMDMLGESEAAKINFDAYSSDKIQLGWDAFMNTLGELKTITSEDDLTEIGHSYEAATALMSEMGKVPYKRIFGVLNKGGDFTGTDVQNRYGLLMGVLTQTYMRTGKAEDVAQRLAALDIIEELNYHQSPSKVSVSSLFSNKILGQGFRRTKANQTPLATRVFRAEEQYQNVDIESILSEMRDSLDPEEIGELLSIRDDYIQIYQGKDLPPNIPSFGEIDNREQLRFLLRVSGQIMAVDPTLKMRLEPNVLRILDTGTNIGSSQDRQAAVTILNNMITQEFNLAELLSE